MRVSNGNDFCCYGRSLALSALPELQISKYISKNNKAEYVMSVPVFCMTMFYFDGVGIHQQRSCHFTGLE